MHHRDNHHHHHHRRHYRRHHYLHWELWKTLKNNRQWNFFSLWETIQFHPKPNCGAKIVHFLKVICICHRNECKCIGKFKFIKFSVKIKLFAIGPKSIINNRGGITLWNSYAAKWNIGIGVELEIYPNLNVKRENCLHKLQKLKMNTSNVIDVKN